MSTAAVRRLRQRKVHPSPSSFRPSIHLPSFLVSFLPVCPPASLPSAVQRPYIPFPYLLPAIQTTLIPGYFTFLKDHSEFTILMCIIFENTVVSHENSSNQSTALIGGHHVPPNRSKFRTTTRVSFFFI